jgi:hypothetical protein
MQLYLDNVPVTLPEAYKQILGEGTKTEKAPFSLAAWSKEHIFTILEQNISIYDRKTDKPKLRVCKGVSVETATIVRMNDATLGSKKLQIATSRRPVPGLQGEYIYNPYEIEIGEEGFVKIKDNPEMAFFLTVHARSRNSGNDHEGVTKSFMRFSKKDKNKEKMAKESYKHSVRSLIIGVNRLTNDDLRAWASTIVHLKQENMFGDVPTSDIEDIQDELLRLTDLSPENVKLAFQSFKHAFRKAVDLAVANKILSYNRKDYTWHFVDKEGADIVVMQLKQSEKGDPTELLIDFFSDVAQDKGRIYQKLEKQLEDLKLV